MKLRTDTDVKRPFKGNVRLVAGSSAGSEIFIHGLMECVLEILNSICAIGNCVADAQKFADENAIVHIDLGGTEISFVLEVRVHSSNSPAFFRASINSFTI
jgi:hypothetical protein